MKNEWWSNISEEIQSVYDRKDSKTMYSLLPKAFGPHSSNVVSLRSKDGASLLKEPSRYSSVLARTHFKSFFLNPSEVNFSVIDSLPQYDITHLMNLTPTIDEVRIALKQINSGKAPGLDGIPVELLQHGGENILSSIHSMFTFSWKGTPIP